ncbi:LysR substrate-binding domain-containing protein [Priestia megaterium]|uniref:LysR substrate-binding domain-containing protein n=1 Tax=Priestia megaterium TaxID=1404 RepID=UPI002E22A9D2|nr:LysR substrate-binding domain-containing protein [Priestia megaterium]MED4279934.1 LysR substrate-binding domain-containing protein [Priestia megaterium]MED4319146.1 LysR substrate-binding domain-containing protein [Priestia megaterium]
MELRHLKYFKTVAEELHFGKAAARLNMAQPPLSLQIRKLEEELGVSLFYRTKRHVELTKEGQVFLEKVYLLFKSLDESIETVRMVSRGELGEIVIGFLASSAYDVLPTIIKHYRKQYPSIHVVLKQQTSAEQLKALQEGTIQIGIISEPIEDETLNFEIIRRESMVVALPKEHPLASKTSSIDLIELANDPFILIGRKSNQHHYDGVINSCYEAGFSPNIVQETAEMSTVISLVSAGIGVAIVPASIQLLLQNEVIYRDIRNNKFNTVTALVWESKNQSSIVKAFVELVKESVIPIFIK